MIKIDKRLVRPRLAALVVLLTSTLLISNGLTASTPTLLSGFNGFESTLLFEGVGISSSTINDAIGYWQTCPSYATGFPVMQSTTSDQSAILVIYHQGDSNTNCGIYHPSSNVIELWDRGQTQGGQSYQCNVTDTLAHEMGHALNLGNSSCAGNIMAATSVSQVNGDLIAGTRSVQSEECSIVNSQWTTAWEQVFHEDDGGGPCGV